MAIDIRFDQALEIWRGALTEHLRRKAPDLTQRQLAILLTVYLRPPPHTVRGLAAEIDVSKPAVTRALDRLEELGLAQRRIDERDRRSVLVQRTVRGSVYLRDFADLMLAAALANP